MKNQAVQRRLVTLDVWDRLACICMFKGRRPVDSRETPGVSARVCKHSAVYVDGGGSEACHVKPSAHEVQHAAASVKQVSTLRPSEYWSLRVALHVLCSSCNWLLFSICSSGPSPPCASPYSQSMSARGQGGMTLECKCSKSSYPFTQNSPGNI